MSERHIYTIPPGADFLKSLVRGLKIRFREEELSRALILLPTRRACQHLREAFLSEIGNDGALLLPDIRPLAEVEEEELMLSAGADFLREVAALPRPIEETQRRLLLACQIEVMQVPGVSKAHAFLLAGELGRLIDDALIEGCDFQNLSTLVPKDYAEHWQQIIAFLGIVRQHWPEILCERSVVDAVDYRQRLTRLLISHWQKHPPDYPVIAAGSTGSQPVTAEFLTCIANLPHGAVVLPGLDEHLEEEAWVELEASHPQYYLARLLRKMEVGREQVKPWPGVADGASRTVLLSEVMRPAEAADRWRHLKSGEIPAEAWAGLEVIEAAHEHEEAFIAALMLRKAVEEEGVTAALVTPNRALAKRVGALMRRWNIELDDSAGQPLLETPVGTYLTLLLDLPRGDLRPSQLMAFLKHPFTGLGWKREDLLTLARHLESDFFREQPRGRGLKIWTTLLKQTSEKESLALVEKICALLAPFSDETPRPLQEWTKLLQKTATQCAADDNLLWREVDGEVLAKLMESLENSGEEFSCNFADFAEIFRAMMSEAVVRRPWGQHPRLAILGLLEARLLRFGRVILAGLNEGTWPQERRPDPWMSPAMRVDLGCADPEARIGQMAHDFVQQAAGPKVAILRSRRAGENPTIPSRWLLQLEAVRKLLGAEISSGPWREWSRTADFCAEMEPCAPPAVPVPVAALPSRLSASAVELWLRDPYAFYARHVLHLKALSALDAEFSARERGTLFHEALQKLAERYKQSWIPHAEADFIQYIQSGFADYGCTPGEIEILSARLAELSHEYWVFEQDRRAQITALESECAGALAMRVENYSFSLEARADRIEDLKSGGLSILDYKTTALPPKGEMESGLRPQLYVEAIIGDAGSFEKTSAAKIAEIAYLQFDQGQGEVKFKNLPLASGDVEKIHRPGFENFVRAYLGKEAKYLAAPRPQLLAPAQDYARLARVAEWSKGAVLQEDSQI